MITETADTLAQRREKFQGNGSTNVRFDVMLKGSNSDFRGELRMNVFMHHRRWTGLALVMVVAAGCSSTPVPPDAPKSRAQREPDRLVVPVTALQPIRREESDAPTDTRELAVTVRPFSEWTEQEVAADTLARIGANAVPTLVEALRLPDAAARLRAVEVLGRMGADAKTAVPDLVPLLDDPDLRVRKATARTLGRIGPDAADAIPVLMRSLLAAERN